MVDFNTPGYTIELARRMAEAVNEYSASTSKNRYQTKMSPSSLAKECSAQMWYKWRNVKLEKTDGQRQRTFDTGNELEPKLIDLLRGTGWTIYDRMPQTQFLMYHAESDCYLVVDDETAQHCMQQGCDDVSDIPGHIARAKQQGVDYYPPSQWKCEDFDGHFVGFADGIGFHPELTFSNNVLVEAKTMNAKNFRTFISKGIAISHPDYYAQAIVYMKYFNLDWCVFAVWNKDDSDVKFEWVKRNDGMADDWLRRAHSIMTMKITPEKIAYSAAFGKCKYCTFSGICHYGEPVDINCRSCIHCVPAPDGKFYCERWQQLIPNKEAIRQGCGDHTPVK